MRIAKLASILSVAMVALGCGSPGETARDGGADAPSPVDAGPDGLATLAPAGDEAQKGPVDGIHCDTSEQLVFHIHAHLEIFVDGVQKLLAPGIGIGTPLVIQNGFVTGGSCFSWLHTHDETGVIHIESPIHRVYTLGNFFDIWGQPLSSSQVGPAHGKVSAFLNGKPYTGALSSLPLDAHNVIQLDVGKPFVAPQPYTFPPGL